MVMYFSKYLITSTMSTYFVVVTKFLRKYMPMYLIFSCAKGATYMWQNSILIFYINTFQRKQFTKLGIDRGFAWEWLVGVLKTKYLINSPSSSASKEINIMVFCRLVPCLLDSVTWRTTSNMAATPAPLSSTPSTKQHLSRFMTKPTKWHLRPSKTQIILGIRPVWSESSLSAWRNIKSLATHCAHSEDSDQTGWMPRLIWVFAGRTSHFVGFVIRWLNACRWQFACSTVTTTYLDSGLLMNIVCLLVLQ